MVFWGMAAGKFISYLRVSTDKQGRSGLGIEAQKAAVRRFAEAHSSLGSFPFLCPKHFAHLGFQYFLHHQAYQGTQVVFFLGQQLFDLF